MGSGYKNIKHEDGKPFEKGNKAAQKWTEKKALELGEGLILWLKEKETNIFWEEYFVIEMGLYPTVYNYLGKKYSAFSRLLEVAKKIQEIKLNKWAAVGKLSSSFTKFLLINQHGYTSQGVDVDLTLNQQQNVHVILPYNERDDLSAFKEADILTPQDIEEIRKEKELERK